LALGLAASVAACGSGSGSKASSDKFVIGTVQSISGSFADTGQAIVNGAKVAVDEVNAAGGIEGRKVELKVLDDAGDPAKSQLATKQLVEQDKVDFLLPNPLSFIRQVTLPYETQRKVFTIAPSSAGELGDGSKYPYSFLNGELNSERSTAMATLLKSVAPGAKVGVLYTNTTAQIAEAQALPALVSKSGMSVVKSIQLSGNATDLTAELANLRAAGATVVTSAAQYGNHINVLMSGMQTIGWKAPVYFFPEAVTGDVGPQVPAAVRSQFHALQQVPVIETNPADPAMSSFTSALSKFGEIKYLLPAALEHDAVWLAKWIYETAKKDEGGTSPDALKKTAESISTASTPPENQLVFRPGPGWHDNVHSTAGYDYSTFYGVIGYGSIHDGQYKGQATLDPK